MCEQAAGVAITGLKLKFVSLIGCALLNACAPQQFVSSTDISADVRTKIAGFAPVSGRLNVDCLDRGIVEARFKKGERPSAAGIPANCPKVLSGASNSSVEKRDLTIVLDTSENMMMHFPLIKSQLTELLAQLKNDAAVASVSAVSFRSKIVAIHAPSDPDAFIQIFSADSPDWNAGAYKTVDPNSTAWVTNDALKAMFFAIEEGASLLKSGRGQVKELIVVSASTGTGSAGLDAGPTAMKIHDVAGQIEQSGGRFHFHTVASDTLSSGLTKYHPTALEQLDYMVSLAALRVNRFVIPHEVSTLAERIRKATSFSAGRVEECLLREVRATTLAGELVFAKVVDNVPNQGIVELNFPDSMTHKKLNLAVRRQCRETGHQEQTVSVVLEEEQQK